jgi:hypothetical protein
MATPVGRLEECRRVHVGCKEEKQPGSGLLSSRHGADDEEGLGSGDDGLGQRGVRRLVGKILLAGEVPDERTPTLGHVIADSSAKDRVGALECVQDGRHSRPSWYVDGHFSFDARERSEMCREFDSNHHDLG